MDKDRSNLRSILNICMVILAPDASQFKQQKGPCSTKSTLKRDCLMAFGVSKQAVIRPALAGLASEREATLKRAQVARR
jgi:hypothetical protein